MTLSQSAVRFQKKQKSDRMVDQSYWLLIFTIELWDTAFLLFNVYLRNTKNLGPILVEQIKQRLEISKEDLKKNKVKTVIECSSLLEKFKLDFRQISQWASKMHWDLFPWIIKEGR